MSERRGRPTGPMKLSAWNWFFGGPLLVPKDEVAGSKPKVSNPKKSSSKKSSTRKSAKPAAEASPTTSFTRTALGTQAEVEKLNCKPDEPLVYLCCHEHEFERVEMSPSNHNQEFPESRTEEANSKPAAEAPKKDNSATDKPMGPSFTAEQDAELLRLKAENVSWKQISMTIGLAKKHVQQRYRQLENAKAKGKNATGESSAAGVETGDQAPDEEAGNESNDVWGGIFNDVFGDNKGDGTGNNKSQGKPETNKGHGSKGGKDRKRGNENNRPKKQGKGTNGGDGGTGGSDHSGVREEKTGTIRAGRGSGGSDQWRNRNHETNGWGLYENTYANPKRRLLPDMYWNQEDCEILEGLVNRSHAERWLNIQAGFYNVTGRMVRSELLERKIREAFE